MVELADLVVDYPDFSTSFTLAVPRGALCAVIGPSGGGKTTMLHAIAGFVAPASGRLSFDGRDLLPLAPAARPLSILFQEHNLFPHLTAGQNVGLGINPRLRLTTDQWTDVDEALARVDLAGLSGRQPGALSGGQRQRVALARALVRHRPLMLLDEPFTGLDPGLRLDMIRLVDDLRREVGLTVLMAIHTPGDVVDLAELMAFVDGGRVASVGPPAEVLESRIPALEHYFRRGDGS